MKDTLSKSWMGLAAVAAAGLGGAAVAAGAGSSSNATTTTTSTASPRPARTPETPLTGDVAARAKAAAVAKVGGNADWATTENDSSNPAAAYEVHVTTADGAHVTVILDKDDNVLAVETGHGFGRHERGGHGPGGNGETELTGDLATKAKAAAVAKVGGTADRATTENDGSNAAAKYEVHVTKTDGTHVEVILDKDLAVLGVETRGDHGGPDHFDHRA